MTVRCMHGIGCESEIFLGRNSELEHLCEAIRKRESVLVWGASDSGKSTLVARALGANYRNEWPNGASAQRAREVREMFFVESLTDSQKIHCSGRSSAPRPVMEHRFPIGSTNKQACVCAVCCTGQQARVNTGFSWKIWPR